ncbi:MAG: DUF58 domain-containing protein, partial [Actinomycetota bacterium]|nr:DUF58 domain-containing protein [Actinomycetota bacterium]
MRPAALTVALGVLLLLAGGTFDAEPLYVPGAAFVLLGLFAVAWVGLGALGLAVERDVAARTVLEDQPVAVSVRVRAGLTPLLTGAVDHPLLPAPVPFALGRREMALRINASFARRGRRVLAPVNVVVRDPLGLATVTLATGAEAELLVLPRICPVASLTSTGEDGALSQRSGRPRMAAEVELDGVRPHRPGAPASRIQWSIFARTGELWERRLVADGDSRPLIVLDPRTAGAEHPEAALDAAVRAAASLAVTLAKQGGCSILLPGDRRPILIEPGLNAWPRAHIRLALVTGNDRAPRPAGVAGRAGAVIYVGARPIGRTPRALQGSGGASRILVLPEDAPSTAAGPVQPGRRAVFTVAGCTGYALRGAHQE